MAKRKQDRGTSRPKPVPVPRSSFVLILTSSAAIILVGILYALKTFNVTLGQGSLFYRYSPLDGLRTLRALPTIGLALLAAAAIFNLSQAGIRRAIGIVCAWLLLIFSAIWIWVALPSPIVQHSFNMRSPSQEGAFYIETMHMPPLPQYLREFDQHIQHSPKDMLGTRVLSNPPGMTILAVAVEQFLPAQTDPPGPLERYLLSIGTPPFDLTEAVDTTHLSMVLVALWAVSAIALYGAARLFLSPPAAFACAVIATFTPGSLHFTPGKDSAQLLTINLMMWTWLAAWKYKSRSLAAVSGAFLAIGAISGLIHFWIALALFAAIAWEIGIKRTLLNMALPALAGIVAVIIAIEFAIGWNVAHTWLAVFIRFGQIQKTFEINRTIWFFIGLPLFALFLGSGQITFAVLTARRHKLNFGAKLAIATAAIMLLTYLVGVTYELPRLWVAFMPPLTLGLMAAAPLARSHHRKAIAALALIVGVQILSATWHWTLLDVRESEYRLSQQKFFN